MQNIFQTSLHLRVPQAAYIVFSCPSDQNSHVSHTAYNRNFILIPKDAEHAVFYSILIHFIVLSSCLDFKLL